MLKQALVVVVSLLLVGGVWTGCANQKGPSAEFEKEWAYTVKEGDASFADIAARVYGDAKYGDLIAKANPKADEKQLQAGQKLIITELKDAQGRALPPKECDRRKVY